MKTEEFLEILESVDIQRLTAVEIHSADCYVGIQLAKREFPNNHWFRRYGESELFYFGGRNYFFNDPIRIPSYDVESVYADFDERNLHRGIVVRIYLK